MRDFDEERRDRVEEDRRFRIGGETFTARAFVRPEAIDDYDRMTADTPAEEALATLDRLIVDLVEDDDAADRWATMRQNTDSTTALDLTSILELVKWLVERHTGRPTAAPSPSAAGRVSTVPSSGAASSSPEATQAA